jgi:hypothetical protein
VAHKNKKKTKTHFSGVPAQKKCNQDTPTKKIDSHTVRHKMLQLKKGTCKTQTTRNVASTSRMNTPGKTKTLRVAARILSPYPPNTSLHDLVFFCLDPFRRCILGSRTVRLQKKMFSNPHCYAYGKADHHPLRTANRL